MVVTMNIFGIFFSFIVPVAAILFLFGVSIFELGAKQTAHSRSNRYAKNVSANFFCPQTVLISKEEFTPCNESRDEKLRTKRRSFMVAAKAYACEKKPETANGDKQLAA